MTHTMKLKNKPFELILKRLKSVEIRLYDDKRRIIKIGDSIDFVNIDDGRLISAEVIGIRHYNNFIELYDNFDPKDLGYGEDDSPAPSDMLEYYREEDIEKWGTCAITIKLK